MTATLGRLRHGSLLTFAAMVAAIYAVALSLAGRLERLAHPDIVALGISIDLLVVVPAAFYSLVIRRQGWPPAALVPVLVASLVAAARVLPVGHRRPVEVAELLIVPLEVGLLVWLAWRMRSSFRSATGDALADPLETARRTLLGVLGSERAAGILATEVGALFYGLAAWRSQPHVPEGYRAFSQHKESAYGAKLFALLLVMIAEGFGVHLLLLRWNSLAAWIATGLGIYGALWLLGDWRATVLRPILVGEGGVLLRAGLRFTLSVPRDEIVGIVGERPEPARECVKLAILGSPNLWIVLREPRLAHGAYGSRKRVRALGVEADQAAELRRALDPSL